MFCYIHVMLMKLLHTVLIHYTAVENTLYSFAGVETGNGAKQKHAPHELW